MAFKKFSPSVIEDLMNHEWDFVCLIADPEVVGHVDNSYIAVEEVLSNWPFQYGNSNKVVC